MSLNPVVITIVAAVVLVGLWLVLNYNSLVRVRQHVRESWSDIDTELKRRYDLIPNLVEAVKGYATHEEDTLEAVVDAEGNAVSLTTTVNAFAGPGYARPAGQGRRQVAAFPAVQGQADDCSSEMDRRGSRARARAG